MKKLLLLLLTTAALFSSECKYETTGVDVAWEAYKTPLKLGVKGKFDNVVFLSEKAATLNTLVKNTKVKIDTQKVNSNNPGRDAKLVKFFFEVQGIKSIDAEITSVNKELINVNITMNSITKNIPMRYTIDKNNITAIGVIDLADFDMLTSLSTINKACYDLHKGKTWQDVTISFKLSTKKSCK